jgi:hypothetical protein
MRRNIERHVEVADDEEPRRGRPPGIVSGAMALRRHDHMHAARIEFSADSSIRRRRTTSQQQPTRKFEMMHSNRNVWLSFGAVLLLSAVGCSHNGHAVQRSTSSALFESNVTSDDMKQSLNRETLPRQTSDGTHGGMYAPELPDDVRLD